MKRSFQRGLLIAAVIITCVGCSASGKNDFKTLLAEHKGDGYGKVLSDSIADIILDAKAVTCELQSKAIEDSLRHDTICKLPTKSIPVIQYILLHPDNFISDNIVYGRYESWACLKFEASRKRTIYIELDFGLAKWRLLDNEKKVICQRDMHKNRLEILRFMRLLFPNDVTLNILYNNLTAKL